MREAKGWSQAALAAMVGVSQQSESDHERGRAEPDLATLLAYARALGCTVDALLGAESPARLPFAEAGPGFRDPAGPDGAALQGRLHRLEGEVAELRERIAVLETLLAGARRPSGGERAES